MKSPNLDMSIWMSNRTFKYLFVYKRAHFLSLEINQLHDLSLFKNMMKNDCVQRSIRYFTNLLVCWLKLPLAGGDADVLLKTINSPIGPQAAVPLPPFATCSEDR